MTPAKPINQLNPEEVRVECATESGWTNVRKTTVLKGRVMQSGIWGNPPNWNAGGYITNELIPKFESDANAALTLAHALADKGWRYHVFTVVNGDTAAVFFHGNKGEWNTPETATGPHAFALALSRAYLAVVRDGKEQP